MLQINNLDIQYTDYSLIKKDQIILQPNQCIGIRGKSGTGKTSFMKFLNLEYSFGQILYNGQDIQNINSFQFDHITYIDDQFSFIPNLTCHEVLTFALTSSNSSYTVENLLDLVGLNITTTTKPSHLSYGQRVLLSIAYVIAKNDDIVLLDEILSPLDEVQRTKILTLLNKIAHEGKYIFVSCITDVFDSYFDTVLELKNQTVHIVKSYNNHEIENTKSFKNTKKIPEKLLLKSYLKNHFSIRILMIIFLVLLIGYSSAIYNQMGILSNHIAKLNQMINPNNCTIYLKDMPSFVSDAFYSKQGVSKDAENLMMTSELISKVYPEIHFSIESMFNYDKGNPTINEDIYKIDVDGKIYEIFKFSEREARQFTVVPYFDKHLDNSCDYVNESGTLYINSEIAKLLQIDNNEHNSIIKMTVLIPVCAKHYTIQGVSGNNSYSYIQQYPQYHQKEIEVKLRGVVNDYYPFNKQSDFLLPQEFMIELYNQYKVDDTYLPFYYTVETNDPVALKNQINQSNSKLVCLQEGELIINSWKKMNYMGELLANNLLIGVIILFVIAVIYNFIDYKINHAYFYSLHKIGIIPKIIKKIRLKRLITDLVMMNCISVIVLTILSFFIKAIAPIPFHLDLALLYSVIITGMKICFIMILATNLSEIYSIVKNS